MITSYLAGEIVRQRTIEAREQGERSRLAAEAKKACRKRRQAAKAKPVKYWGHDNHPESVG